MNEQEVTIYGEVPTIKRRFGAIVPVRVEASDSVHAVGVLMTEVGKQMATQITSTIAQNHGPAYNINITVAIEEV